MKVSNRVWIAGSAGAMVLIAAGGYFLGVQPQLARAAETEAATTSTDAQVAQTQLKIAALSKTAARTNELQQQDATLTKALPSGLQANTFIRRVNTVAALDAVSVDSVSFGAGTAYAPPASVAAAAAPVATPAPSASATPAAVGTTATATAAPVLVVTDPLVTSSNFTVVPTTVVVVGTANDGLQFVKDIQRDERLFLVSAVSSQVNAENAAKTITTLTGSVYALKHGE